MKERPILFSGPMVKAILDGRKVQTRRVVKSVAGLGRVTKFGDAATTGYQWSMRDNRMRWNEFRHDELLERCPHGVPGDRLWVRETWAQLDLDYAVVDGPIGDDFKDCPVSYKADHYDPKGDGPGNPMRWRPSIHMPRWASRLTLEVTEVRVERVQDIGLEDARAEGMDDDFREQFDCGHPDCDAKDNWHYGPTWQFARLWDSINGKKHPWASNPWVWAITFKRVDE